MVIVFFFLIVAEGQVGPRKQMNWEVKRKLLKSRMNQKARATGQSGAQS